MPDEPRVVFHAPSAAAAAKARELLDAIGVAAVEVGDDPLQLWVAPSDYSSAAKLIDEAFPPEGPQAKPGPVLLNDEDDEDPPGFAASPDQPPPKKPRRRLPPGFKVGTIAGCSAFLPYLGSVFAGFALLAAVWLLTRRRTSGRWIALALSLGAVAWQVFLFTRAT